MNWRRSKAGWMMSICASFAFAFVFFRMAAAANQEVQVSVPPTSPFECRLDAGALASLKRKNDTFDTEYVLPGRRLGDLIVRYRKSNGPWREVQTGSLAKSGDVTCFTAADGARHEALYRVREADADELVIRVRFDFEDNSLLWTILLENHSNDPLEVGDLAIPFPMNTVFSWNKPPQASVLKHSYLSGDNSYMFWLRSNSVGPYLLLTTMDGTSFEYWQRERGFQAFIHSMAAGAVAEAKGCRWRQPHTSLKLSPRGMEGDSRTYGMKLQWADDYEDIRRMLVAENKIDLHVIPGMTVPTNLSARIALRTRTAVHAVEAEFPESTSVTQLSKSGDVLLYEVHFSRLGENRLRIRYGEGRQTILEFFCTEPLETLVKKRAAFLARCQHRDPAKWYNGLISEWNMETKTLLGPNNYDRIKGWRIYAVSCDDPGLSKPAYLAAKNAEYPVQAEIDALDYYLQHFVWGGLQRSTNEEYAYGIYGIPDWKTNRDSNDPGPKGKLHLWRIYDYPHVVLFYFSMYRIAENYPHLHTALPAEEYLQRAAGTALAMFEIPKAIDNWSAYATGLYNELVIVDLIKALEAKGKRIEAERLRGHWRKKVECFLNEKPNLFASEYPFDSTGFESTHALAKYALEHAEGAAEPIVGITRKKARQFMETQIAANIFCRGWLEPAYYLLGSDYRGSGGDSYTLSYMSPMGGWAILDYALYYAERPSGYLRLGYASFLGSWALLNSGTPESNYGYWYPGPENDGAAGGGFEPLPYGVTWLEQPHHRGSWYYACESDLGYCGALRCAATIVNDDPLFGRVCFGGVLTSRERGLAVVPKDGVRRRFHAVLGERKLHLLLDGARFRADRAIILNEDFSEVSFEWESESASNHSIGLQIEGSESGEYVIQAGEQLPVEFQLTAGRAIVVRIAADETAGILVIRRKQVPSK